MRKEGKMLSMLRISGVRSRSSMSMSSSVGRWRLRNKLGKGKRILIGEMLKEPPIFRSRRKIEQGLVRLIDWQRNRKSLRPSTEKPLFWLTRKPNSTRRR